MIVSFLDRRLVEFLVPLDVTPCLTMRFPLSAVASLAFLSWKVSCSDAFVPQTPAFRRPLPLQAVAVPTKPIEGMKPGTSGLRKKVEVWQETDHYVENFIQSLLDTATAKNGGSVPDT